MENKRKALGTGLSVLFSNESIDLDTFEKKIVNETKDSDIVEIPLTEIRSNPYQPRKEFDEQSLREFADSIKEHGVIQPIIVRKVGDKYEIIAGERRFRASQLAGKATIPALVRNIDDKEAAKIALLENLQRKDLTPIEEANAYKNLMECCDYELPDVSRLIGKSESYIRNMLRLTSLPTSVQNLVEQGELSASHARTIAVAENPEALAHKIVAEKLSVSDTERLVKSAPRATASRKHITKTIDAKTVQDIEKKISSTLGFSVKLIERRGGAGQISISFATRTQMYELVEKLTKKNV
jgi:ParB family chromosome partitioning protein